MTTKIILRPERNEKTPTALREALGSGWTTKRWPGFTSGQANFGSDFFMIYPEASKVLVPSALTETYAALRNFYQKNKPNQRLTLGSLGLPIPQTATIHGGMGNSLATKWVVRPLRHEGGQNYRVTTNRNDFVEGSEYIAELFPKEREYRLLYVFGQLTCFWQKKKAENETNDGPWGAEGHSAFAAVTEPWENSYLFRHTDAREQIGNTFVARDSHIVAFDVLYSHTLRSYVVLEANVCPALYWSPASVTKVVSAITGRPAVAATPPASQPAQQAAPVAAEPTPATPAPRRTGSPAVAQQSVPAQNQAAAPRVPSNRFRIQAPQRPVIRLIPIDMFGIEMELTVQEIDGIIHQLEEAKAA